MSADATAMARAVRTNWRLKSMANCPNSRGPGAHDIDSKDEPVAPYDYDAEKSAGRNQPVAAAQASRGASLLPDVHLQIAFTICRRSRAPDKPPSCPSPRCRSGCRCDAPCRGRPRDLDRRTRDLPFQVRYRDVWHVRVEHAVRGVCRRQRDRVDDTSSSTAGPECALRTAQMPAQSA